MTEPQQQDEGTRLDRMVARGLETMGQQSSRRGVLARLGKLALAALGVATVEVLPVDRMVPTAEAQSVCNDSRLCGIYGRVCTCCNNGNPITYCPYGVTQFSYWQSCCSGRIIRYWDCCNGTVNCNSCTWCLNGPSQPAWCNGGVYKCTAIVDAGAC